MNLHAVALLVSNCFVGWSPNGQKGTCVDMAAELATGWHYDFLAPATIRFGWGRLAEVGTLCRAIGQRAFLISGSRTLSRSGIVDQIVSHLRQAQVEPVLLPSISREPLIDDVADGVDRLRELGAGSGDLVLAVGGGAAIDLGKALAGLSTQAAGAPVRDYLEGIGRGLQIEQDPLPIVAVPTTAGTGSEATKNAVISSLDPPVKKSLRNDRLMPRAVLVDPELTVSVPPAITAATGMDAITQLIESYISRRARPIPRALAEQGLQDVVPALLAAYERGETRWARERMAHAALLSGMALANSGLGLAHGVAAALGVHCDVPHGRACAALLPTALRANRSVCETDLARLATLMTGRTWSSPAAAADACIETVCELCAALDIPTRLSALGVRREQLPLLVRDSRGNSMSGNARELSDEELGQLLETIW